MKMQVYAVKDRAIGAFMQPWYAQTDGQATRMFQDELNNSNSPFYKHPDDYDLYLVAEWDDNMGRFYSTEPHPKQIALGKQLKGV